MPCSWLPALLLLNDYGGDWTRYEDAVYNQFKNDLINHPPTFRVKKFVIDRRIDNGKEKRYWHMISEGPVEPERTPDISRCERIAWVKPMIEEPFAPRALYWKTTRQRPQGGIEKRILVAPVDFSYLVVFEDRVDCAFLLTAYPINYDSKKDKLRKEFEKWKKEEKKVG